MRRVDRIATQPSLVARSTLARVDYFDAFRCPVLRPLTVADVRGAMLAMKPPGWVQGLMRMRDRIVALFGLKTSESRDMFAELRRTDDEIVLGTDDRHLDFRLSLRVVANAVEVGTLVQFNSRFGRLYFALIKPFHLLIVPAVLRRALAD
jgi:hypothetical protein